MSFEHIVPEALGCNRVLPKGYVCDSCNNYFSKLDNSILNNRYIALAVGIDEIPGKKNKIRRQIGDLKFFGNGQFIMSLGPRRISGKKEVEFSLKQSKQFNELLFARGIHKITFNCYADRFEMRNALNARFNRLRKYIREASPNELWKYAVRAAPPDGEWHATFYESNKDIVKLHLLCLDFIISLTGWNNHIEDEIRGKGYYIVNRRWQWESSSLLGLLK